MGYETVNTHIITNRLTGSLPVTKIELAGLEVIGLLDCGASVSLVTQSVFQKIARDRQINKIDDPTTIKSICGEKLHILGCYSIPIKLGNKEFKHCFYVVKNDFNSNYRVILGYDFMTTNRLKLNFEELLVSIDNVQIRMMDSNTNSQINNVKSNLAKLKTKYILKPGESQLVNIVLQSNKKVGDEVLITPINNKNIKIEESICSVTKDNTCKILVSNITNKTMHLNKAMNVATISSDFEIRNMEQIKLLRREELFPSDFDLSHLDITSKNKLLALLMEFSDIFSKRLFTIGSTDKVTPEFYVQGENLPSIRNYGVPQILKPILREQIDELLEAGLVEPSNAEISFPLLLIKKRNKSSDGTDQYRQVVDYRYLNDHIKFANYPLPQINQLLDELKGSEYFTNLDLHSSFFQIRLPEDKRKYTTFSTILGNFKYRVLPQGLNVSPGTMQRLTDNIIAPIKYLGIVNYLDDFVLGTNSLEQMLYKLRKLFQELRKAGVTLNPSKCSFMLPKIKVLGHEVDKNGIRPLEDNLRKIKEFPIPNTTKRLQRWLGQASYYRRFIPNFSKIAEPLFELTKKRKKFIWNDLAQQAFDELQDALSKEPILQHPNFSKTFILSTDSSDTCIGATLGHKDESGLILPISYYSKKLVAHQKKWPIHEKELFAIQEAVKAFKHYLYGRHFIVRCDNSAIQSIKKLENPANRLARMILYLNDYDFTFEKIPGSENQVADLFSRDFHQVNLVQVDMPNFQEIKNAQLLDPVISQLITKISKTRKHLTPSEQKYFISDDGVLMHKEKFKSTSPRSDINCTMNQIVIPEVFKLKILQIAHQNHAGHLRTYETIREQFYWRGLYTDVEHFVKSCTDCMGFKTPKTIAPVPIQRHFIPSRPGQMVSCDLVGQLPETSKGHKYFITFVDHFTKFLVAYPMRTQSAEETSEMFFKYITLFGIPENLLTDRGSNFTSQMFQNVANKLGVTKLYTTALNPKCNGKLEVLHGKIKKTVSIWARESRQWDTYLDLYTYFYNNSFQKTIQDKPSYLVFGMDINMPHTILESKRPRQDDSYCGYIEKKTSQLQEAYKKVTENITKASEKQENYQHKKAKIKDFKIGQLVFLYSPDMDRNSGLPKKRSYKGPFRVVERHNLVNYSIMDISDAKKKIQKVNSDRLIPFEERNFKFLPELKTTEEEECLVSKPKPHAQFDAESDSEDELPLAEFLRRTKLINSESNQRQRLNVHCDLPEQAQELSCSNESEPGQELNYDSDATETYSPKMQENQKLEENSNNSSRYNLRPRNSNTQPTDNEPHIAVKWLERITEALRD